jgi:hypothetical protein
VAMINNPGLNAIGRQIVSEPGFRFDEHSLRRAYEQWEKLASPLQRKAAEQVFLFEWLQGLHREWLREQEAPSRPPAPAVPSGERPRIIPGEPERPAAPEAELKFQSESAGWREPEPEPWGRPPASRWEPPPTARRDPPRPSSGPVSVTRLGDRAPVQQPSRKVEQYQRMFPELGRPVATASGPKALAECGDADLAFRMAEIDRQGQAWRSQNSADEARIEDREKLNARDRVAIAQRQQYMSAARAEKDRLALARKALEDYGAGVVGDLIPEALQECGFTRAVA